MVDIATEQHILISGLKFTKYRLKMLFEVFGILLLVGITYQAKQNVLFIVVDDLRPNIGAYGYKNAYTPNIDKLAERSIVFNRAYAQQALCAPSRNSFLTSRRPDSLHLYDFYSYWRDAVGNFTTLPQFFKQLGYKTHSIGKVFHPGISSNFTDDEKYSWSYTPFHPSTEIYKEAKVCPTESGELKQNLICPVIVEEQPGGSLPDLESLNAALDFLENINETFFLAVGFHKPHIPLKYPIEYLNFHPMNEITLPSVRQKPYGLPSVAFNPWTDLRARDDIKQLNISFPYGVMPDETTKKIIQSYNAAITYVDDLIGDLLRKVDNNTIIVFTGDHGWNLGDNGEFSKFSNFEFATRVPLIIRVPNLTKGQSTNNLVELVDIFPTLTELTTGFTVPICPKSDPKVELCTEGKSLVPLIASVAQNKEYKGKSAAFYQYPRPGIYPTEHPNSDKPRLKDIKIMGYSIRTKTHRYTEWVSFNNKLFKPNWGKVYNKELYDFSLDPLENMNLADNPEFKQLIDDLSKKLRLGWRYQ